MRHFISAESYLYIFFRKQLVLYMNVTNVTQFDASLDRKHKFDRLLVISESV